MECGASFGELLDLVHDVRIVLIVISKLLYFSKVILLLTITKRHIQVPASGQSKLPYVCILASGLELAWK